MEQMQQIWRLLRNEKNILIAQPPSLAIPSPSMYTIRILKYFGIVVESVDFIDFFNVFEKKNTGNYGGLI